MDRHVPLHPDPYELRRFPHRSPGRDIYPVPGPFPTHLHRPPPLDKWKSLPPPPPRYDMIRSPPRHFSPRHPPSYPHGHPRPPLPIMRRSLSPPPPRSPHYRSPHRMYPDHPRPFESEAGRNIPFSHGPSFPTNDRSVCNQLVFAYKNK